MPDSSVYENDFALWLDEQAAHARARHGNAVDWDYEWPFLARELVSSTDTHGRPAPRPDPAFMPPSGDAETLVNWLPPEASESSQSRSARA